MKKGFTLIEMMVSVSIFSMVMLIATGSVFSIVEANKKTHALKSVMTNLNFALESMARDIRVGSKYGCDASSVGQLRDCASGGSVFQYKANRDVDLDGLYSYSDSSDFVEYSLVGNRIQKKIYGNNPSTVSITASEIVISSMRFYVIGTGDTDHKQPKAVITIKGYAGTGKTKSDFTIQTTVSQRSIDS